MIRALLLALLVAPTGAAAQIDALADPVADPSDVEVSSPLRLDVRGCVPEDDALAQLHRFVALEARGVPEGARATLWLRCDGDSAEVLVHDRRGRAVRTVQLGEDRGRARWWTLALVITDLARTLGARTAPPPAAAPASPTSSPETSLALGVVGWLGFDGPTGAVLVEIAIAHAWFRAALQLGGTYIERRFGAILAGMALLDVAVTPVSHREPGLFIGAELFAQGGAAYAAGMSTASGVTSSEVAVPLLAGGLGVRFALGAALDAELVARVGYQILGADLRDEDGVALRLHGAFGAIGVGVRLR